MLLWQNSYNPKKKAQHAALKPKPFIPEFMKKPIEPGAINNGVEVHTTEDVQSILDLPRG